VTWRRLEPLLFLVVVGACLAPVWLPREFLTQDGPRLVHNVVLLHQLLGQAPEVVDATYSLHLQPLPGLFTFALLSPLVALAPPALAQKLAFSLFVVGLPLATRVALRWLGATRPELAWLALPLVHTVLLGLGLLGFCSSLVLFVLGLVAIVSTTVPVTRRSLVVLAALGLGLYLVHPLTLVVSLLCLATVQLCRVGTLLVSPARAWAPLARDLGWQAVALAPSLLLLAWYLSRPGGGAVGQGTLGVGARVQGLLTMDLLLRASVWDLVPALGFGVLMLVLFAASLRLPPRQLPGGASPRALLAAAGACLLWSLVVPDQVGGGSVVALRSQVFAYLALILWLGTQRWSAGVARGVALACAAVVGVQVVLSASHQLRLQADLAEVDAVATAMEPGRVLLPVVFSSSGLAPDGTPRMDRSRPLGHVGARLATASRGVDMANWQYHTRAFPVRYRPTQDPFEHLVDDPSQMELEPPPVDIAAWERASGAQVDYVLTIADPGGHPALRTQLDQHYRRVATSPRGLAVLYRRTP